MKAEKTPESGSSRPVEEVLDAIVDIGKAKL
jgi:hypothetical protein